MLIKILPGVIGLALGLLLQKYAFDEKGEMKGKIFLTSVSIGIVSQIYLVYEYIELRGGFKVHNCVYGVTLALLMGALVLWASRMLFAFDHEGFRVLLGVGAIAGGWLAGNGLDLIVASKSEMALITSPISVYALMLGAIAVLISGAGLALKVFSPKPKKIHDTIHFTSMSLGVIFILAGAILG